MQRVGCGTLLQNYSNQNNMGLAQKTCGSMELNKEPRNKYTHVWSINLQQRRQEYTMKKRVSSATDVEKAGQPHVNQ